MSEFLAARLKKIKPSPTIAVTARAAQLRGHGVDVIGLGAGEPDFATPAILIDAAKQALDAGKTKYTPAAGIPELRKSICEKFRRENRLDYTPEQITIGCGGKQILYHAFLATLDEGDEVIIPAPYWVSYVDQVLLSGGKPVIVNCPQNDSFKPTPEKLQAAITPKTKWLILNSPANPTGAVMSRKELETLAEVLRPHPHVHILSDDIYEHIRFQDSDYVTFANVAPDLHDRILTVNGVSKAYVMTGFRLGYAAGNPVLIKAMNMLNSQTTTSAATVSQWAAITALEKNHDFLRANKEIFRKRRDAVAAALNDIDGVSCTMPEGAFYVYPSCENFIGKPTPQGKTIANDEDFAHYLLDEAHVAVVHGAAFGMSPYFRISYAADDDSLKQACERIRKACAALQN